MRTLIKAQNLATALHPGWSNTWNNQYMNLRKQKAIGSIQRFCAQLKYYVRPFFSTSVSHHNLEFPYCTVQALYDSFANQKSLSLVIMTIMNLIKLPRSDLETISVSASPKYSNLFLQTQSSHNFSFKKNKSFNSLIHIHDCVMNFQSC